MPFAAEKIYVLKGIFPKKANELTKLKSGKQDYMRKTIMGRRSGKIQKVHHQRIKLLCRLTGLN